MDEEVRKEKGDEEFERRKEELRRRDEAKTRRNQARREKMKARRARGKGEGMEGVEKGEVGGKKGSGLRNELGMVARTADQGGDGLVDGTVGSEELGVVIHDDD